MRIIRSIFVDAFGLFRFISVFSYPCNCVISSSFRTSIPSASRLELFDRGAAIQQHDDALLPLVAKGDGQAMKRCIDRYGPLVWSIVCRRISERNDAEETCQEIFTEIWQKAGSYDPETSRESTFIGMIARRRSIDWQRKQSRLPLLTELDSVPEVPSSNPLVGIGLDRELLWKALEKLPKKTRDLFSFILCKE